MELNRIVAHVIRLRDMLQGLHILTVKPYDLEPLHRYAHDFQEELYNHQDGIQEYIFSTGSLPPLGMGDANALVPFSTSAKSVDTALNTVRVAYRNLQADVHAYVNSSTFGTHIPVQDEITGLAATIAKHILKLG